MEVKSFLPSCFDLYLYMCACESVYHMCVGACGFPRVEITGSLGPLLNLDPLEEQDERFLTTEPSLQILKTCL